MRSTLFILTACLATWADEPAVLPGFEANPEFAEQVQWQHLSTGVRVYVNAPLPVRNVPRTLVVFATPNGNSIEQTIGCQLTEGLDWHYDIQHVAAQLRCFRSRDSQRVWILAVTDCPQQSWPTFRRCEPNATRKIRNQIERLMQQTGCDSLVLACHSGGGAFVFGWIESSLQIPDHLERLVFLDANYAYDNELHAERLLSWLHGNTSRHLIVMAYDDREITYQGKKVVGPTGGTYRATQRMIDRFGETIEWSRHENGAVRSAHGLSGQIQLLIHTNPENKILHTALVGEMNGLLQGLVVGTPGEANWDGWQVPRVYTSWIAAAPVRDPLLATPARIQSVPALAIGPRAVEAPTGRQFREQIQSLTRADREQAILAELRAGNVPDYLRQLKAIHLTSADAGGKEHIATCYVTPDYVAVGNNDDFFRLPLTPMSAQQIGDAWQGSLITTRISDAIFRSAEQTLPPHPLTQDRESVATFYQHQEIIESQRAAVPLDRLRAGIKKDVVWTRLLPADSDRVAIYGWHQPDGTPIQPLYLGHVHTYVDYSHGIRLMSRQMWVDGEARHVSEVLRDENLRRLLENE